MLTAHVAHMENYRRRETFLFAHEPIYSEKGIERERAMVDEVA